MGTVSADELDPGGFDPYGHLEIGFPQPDDCLVVEMVWLIVWQVYYDAGFELVEYDWTLCYKEGSSWITAWSGTGTRNPSKRPYIFLRVRDWKLTVTAYISHPTLGGYTMTSTVYFSTQSMSQSIIDKLV